MLLVTIGGILIVSALIGVIATGLDAKLEDLRKGRSFVVETGHTLILDWSDSIFTILSELAIANESERRPVAVVLAHRRRGLRDLPQAGNRVHPSGGVDRLRDRGRGGSQAERGYRRAAEAGDVAKGFGVVINL